jgi:uncharacterized membrane protein YhiD involved in acid resistance
MEQNLQDIFVFSLTVKEAISNILVALVCGIMISLLYRITYKGVNYPITFANAIIMLTMITALIIMVIGNNLARAFGLVGAMSIIRFRTAVKDSQDIMFIFFALGIGLSAGVGIYAVTFTSTILIGLAIYLTTRINRSDKKKKVYLLQILAEENIIPDNAYGPILDKHCVNQKLINIKTLSHEKKDLLEISHYVKLKYENQSEKMIKDLKSIPGTSKVNLFFDEE